VPAAACRAPLPGPERQWRSAREQAVLTELPPGARAGFQGLRFYPFDASYRFRAMLEPVEPPQPLRLAVSSGTQRPAHRVGRLRLRMPAGDALLSVYLLDDLSAELPEHLFLPFRDAGAGSETYGAGRYVDVERLAGGVVAIDFNRAYNPDCAYGISAQCPITPVENTVPFAVRAGEMTPPGRL
jgi:uncharacterized protein (DUF1684 family)